MSYPVELAEALSTQYRDFVSQMPVQARRNLEASLLMTTSVKALRNVQLWASTGTTQRNILNRTLGADEFNYRRRFVEALLGLIPVNAPQKFVQKIGQTNVLAYQFAVYMGSAYIRGTMTRVEFLNDAWELEFLMDSATDEEEIEDEDLEEFEGIS